MTSQYVRDAVPDQGCAGPVAYIVCGAPSPGTCNSCHFNGCKRNSGGKKINQVGVKEDGNFNRLIISVNYFFVKP